MIPITKLKIRGAPEIRIATHAFLTLCFWRSIDEIPIIEKIRLRGKVIADIKPKA